MRLNFKCLNLHLDIALFAWNFRTVASAFIAADEDPCNDALEVIFGKKHSCDIETTFCFKSTSNETNSSSIGAVNSAYTCLCNFGYYVPNQTLQGFESHSVESGSGNFSCIRCPGGCANCNEKGECSNGEEQEFIPLDTLLRFSIGVILSTCMLCCVVLTGVVFKRRKFKTISIGMWTVLETILFGILLMYAAVGLHFFPASTLRCLLEPWLRELGFIVCYGAIILKLYRHLVEFRTRKAHRWVLRDVDLLKYLSTMVFAVVCYMSAFTASSLDLIQTAALEGLQELNTNTCQPMKWEFVTQISEILILAFGLHLAIASRNANTQYRVSVATKWKTTFFSRLSDSSISDFIFLFLFFFPFSVSSRRRRRDISSLHRFLLNSSYQWSFMFWEQFIYSNGIQAQYFLHCFYVHSWQIQWQWHWFFCQNCGINTNRWVDKWQTVDAANIFGFQLNSVQQGPSDSTHHGGGYAGIYLGDPDIGELTISEMSPADIRAELKR